jgi:hypothetical protein
MKENQKNVITDAQVASWKSEFGKIFKTTVDGDEYVWRKLKRGEYVELMKDKAEEGQEDSKLWERQEKIAKTVVLYPVNISECIEASAGLATTIADEVILKSGFEVATTEEL